LKRKLGSDEASIGCASTQAVARQAINIQIYIYFISVEWGNVFTFVGWFVCLSVYQIPR